MTVESVDQSSLQQVHNLHRAVAGAADQVIPGRVEGKGVDGGTVD